MYTTNGKFVPGDSVQFARSGEKSGRVERVR
jgi:hypothetical protein